jgi:ADP-ribose pyrophosphatase YjhB (NUDIX family)
MREPILSAAQAHQQMFFSKEEEIFSSFREQLETIETFTEYVRHHPNCLHRSHLPGHVTASGVVISRDRKKILLSFHAKLKMWVQLGGHADGNPHLHEVAYREAQEESGIDDLYLPSQIPFDYDIHEIKANSKEPAHLHYDARYLIIASHDNYTISSESLDLKWVQIDRIKEYTEEASVVRLLRKLPYLFKLLDRDLPCSL